MIWKGALPANYEAFAASLSSRHQANGFILKKSPVGFTRRVIFGSHYHTLPFAIRGNEITVTPHIEIRVDALQELLMVDVDISKARKLASATIGAALGEFAGLGFKSWTFLDEGGAFKAASEVWSLFEKYGLPELDKFNSVEGVFEVTKRNDSIGQRWSPIDHERCKAAVGMAVVLGKKNECDLLIEECRTFLRKRRSNSIDLFEAFVSRVWKIHNRV